MINARLLYKSEISGELEPFNIKIEDEYAAKRIMDALVENTSGHICIVVSITNDIKRIPIYKHFKKGKLISIYKLVGIDIE